MVGRPSEKKLPLSAGKFVITATDSLTRLGEGIEGEAIHLVYRTISSDTWRWYSCVALIHWYTAPAAAVNCVLSSSTTSSQCKSFGLAMLASLRGSVLSNQHTCIAEFFMVYNILFWHEHGSFFWLGICSGILQCGVVWCFHICIVRRSVICCGGGLPCKL